MTASPDSHTGAQTLDVRVFAPRFPEEARAFSFNKHLTVEQAAAEVAAAFGYVPGTYSLSKNGEVLDRSKQLVAEHVRDGDELWLVDTGGGV